MYNNKGKLNWFWIASLFLVSNGKSILGIYREKQIHVDANLLAKRGTSLHEQHKSSYMIHFVLRPC